jgi:hypothetical protein
MNCNINCLFTGILIVVSGYCKAEETPWQEDFSTGLSAISAKYLTLISEGEGGKDFVNLELMDPTICFPPVFKYWLATGYNSLLELQWWKSHSRSKRAFISFLFLFQGNWTQDQAVDFDSYVVLFNKEERKLREEELRYAWEHRVEIAEKLIHVLKESREEKHKWPIPTMESYLREWKSDQKTKRQKKRKRDQFN